MLVTNIGKCLNIKPRKCSVFFRKITISGCSGIKKEQDFEHLLSDYLP